MVETDNCKVLLGQEEQMAAGYKLVMLRHGEPWLRLLLARSCWDMRSR
jgi:hypothetical protein